VLRPAAVAEASDPPRGGRALVVPDAAVRGDEDVSRAPALTGLLETGTNIPDAVPQERCCIVAEPRHEEGATHPLFRLLVHLDFDDSELHVDVQAIRRTGRHRDGELAGSVSIANRCA